MQVALRECDFNPIGMEAVPNRQKNRVLDIGNPISEIIDPNPQLQIDRAVTEFPYKLYVFFVILLICVHPCPKISEIKINTVLGTTTAPKRGTGGFKKWGMFVKLKKRAGKPRQVFDKALFARSLLPGLQIHRYCIFDILILQGQ